MVDDRGLRRLILGCLLAAFPGTEPPGWALRLVADGLAGHVLFARNVGTPAQLAALTAALRDARADVVVAVDEEGGDVTRLHHATGSPYPGNAALGAVDDVDLTRRTYAAIGADLTEAGATLDFAPTVDVNTTAENPVIGTRSFGADPSLVARHTTAAVEGLQSAGAAACVKHFPGHGATVTDSHLGLPLVDATPDLLRARDLPPFVAAVRSGARAVMTAHIRVPALTGELPATFSRAALHDLLRGDLGFGGVVVTDALEMRGASGPAGGVPGAAVAALAAGADLLCLGAEITEDLVERTVAAVAGAVRSGRLERNRLEEAVARVGALAAERPRTGPTPVPDAGAERLRLGTEAARRAVRVDGSLDGLRDPYVVHLDARPSIAEGPLPWGLAAHVPGLDQIRAVAATLDPDEVIARAGDRPVVIVGRNLHRLPGAQPLVEAVAARRPTVVVEMGWPGGRQPRRVRATVCTYGASYANGRAAAEALGLPVTNRRTPNHSEPAT